MAYKAFKMRRRLSPYNFSRPLTQSTSSLHTCLPLSPHFSSLNIRHFRLLFCRLIGPYLFLGRYCGFIPTCPKQHSSPSSSFSHLCLLVLCSPRTFTYLDFLRFSFAFYRIRCRDLLHVISCVLDKTAGLPKRVPTGIEIEFF